MPTNFQHIVLPLGKNPQAYMLPKDEIDRRVAAGELEEVGGKPTFYRETKVLQANAPEDLDSVPDEDPQTYATRDMTAQPKRRRGRPPGSKNKPKPAPADDLLSDAAGNE